MLQLVLGGSGSGKTTLLYAKIKERALAGQKSILLVPEQFTASTEQRIYHTLGDAHSGMVESFSFSSLAERVLSSCGGAAIKTLAEAGRAVLVRRAIKEVENRLVYYRKRQMQNAAFCQMVAQTIDELKSAGLDAVQLAHLAEGCGGGRDKMADLALIFAAYEAMLGETELDPTDRVKLAATQLQQACSAGEVPDFLAGRAVFIDEFDTFNAPKKQLLLALFGACESITASLCADGLTLPSAPAAEGVEPHKATFLEDVSLFSGARRVAFDLRTLSRKAGVGIAAPILLQQDLRHANAPALAALEGLLAGKELAAADLAEGTAPTDGSMWASTPTGEANANASVLEGALSTDAVPITLFAAKTREQEAQAMVAQMQQLARSGARYGKMAIVCRNLTPYRTAVQRECRLAGIPLFCDETTTPTFSAPITAIRALLSMVRGIDYTDQMIALAKTGLCATKGKDAAGKTVWVPIPEYQILALENYVYTWSPSRAAWQQPFTRNPEGFGVQPDGAKDAPDGAAPPAETARKAMLAPVQALCDGVRGKTIRADALTKRLYACLQAFGAEQQQAQQVAAVRAVRGIPAAEAAAREWNVVMDLLDQMVRLLGEEEVTLAEYTELFLMLMHTSDLGHIPQNIDAVIFTSAGKMRLDAPEHVFVLGLAEGEFPAPPHAQGLLTDADRDALMAQQIELPDCFENKMVREDVSFYKAMTAPAHSLWLSWPEGLAMPLTSALAPLLAQVPHQNAAVDLWQSTTTPAAAIDRLGSLWGEDSVQAASLAAALHTEAAATDAPWGAALARFDEVAADLPKQLHQPAQVAQLLGDAIAISPSRVEQYYTCQYKYFLQYLLRLRPRQKAELSPSQSGSLMHWVLEQALTAEPTPYDAYKQPSFVALDASGLKTLAEQLVDAYHALYMPEESVRFAYLLTRLKKSMAALLSYVQAERKQSTFETAACEAKIGTDAFPARSYTLGDGKSVSLVGIIDRIDTWQAEDGVLWMRVVDYKTGAKSFHLKEVYDGLDCQMLLYLFAALKQWNPQNTAVRKAAGVQYLLADPAPQVQPRDAAQQVQRPELDGLLRDDEGVLKASDANLTGEYLPFALKNGKVDPRTQKASLADDAKMRRIEAHLDDIVVKMAQGLYAGDIKAEPLCPTAGRTPCQWCEYRTVCGHEDGKGERGLSAAADPFAPPEEAKTNDTTPAKEGE